MNDRPLTPEDEDQLQRLFDRAMDSGPTIAAIDRLVYCHLLDRITDGDLTLMLDTFNQDGTGQACMRELEALTPDERDDLAHTVMPMWNKALGRAVMHMWHACKNLGYDPDG